MGKLERMFPYIFGERLKDHVLVNNWANGWQIDRLGASPSTSLGINELASSQENQNLDANYLYARRYLVYLLLVYPPKL